MRPTDQMLSRISAEIAEKQNFIDGVVEAAEKDGRDLTTQEMEMVTRSRDRQGDLNAQAKPMQEAVAIQLESQERIAEIGKLMSDREGKAPQKVEYRNAGEYILDYWRASLGADEVRERLDLYNRAAAHQTTADNPGLLPSPILGPVINYIDTARPMVTSLGPRQIPGSTFNRPKVTQHTNVAVQPTGEKNELVSQKMTITKNTVTAGTYGGYCNISRQDLDFTSPGILDIVINDLAGKYGTVTETALGTALVAGSTAGTTIPTGTPTTAALSAALWAAAASCYTAVAGQGRLMFYVSPDMLALWAPLFAPVNPQTAQSPGFSAADFSSGAMGSISGIPVYMSAGLASGSNLVVSSAAVEVYEDRIGSLQVVEPSVLGLQVAYAGYFTWLIADAGGVIKITKTP